MLIEGRILGWYSTIENMLIIAAMVFIVYTLVWVFSYISEKTLAVNVNKALQNYNNGEDDSEE